MVQSRFAETRFAKTLTLTRNPNPNFGESGRHRPNYDVTWTITPVRLYRPPTMPSWPAHKTGIFAVNARCDWRLIHFDTVIPAGCWRMVDICMNKSRKGPCLRAVRMVWYFVTPADLLYWKYTYLLSVVMIEYRYTSTVQVIPTANTHLSMMCSQTETTSHGSFRDLFVHISNILPTPSRYHSAKMY